MCQCNCQSRTSISKTLVPAGTALANTYVVEVLQRLCSKICLTANPVFNLAFTYVDSDIVDATSGVFNLNIRCSGTITYNPVNSGNCCERTDIINAVFAVPVTSTTGIQTVTITEGINNGEPIADASRCGCNTTNLFRITTAITVTATAPTA